MWVVGQPFSYLRPSYWSQCGSFYKSLAMRLLFQLAYSWLFGLIVLYFSGDSNLVWEGNECSFHVLGHRHGPLAYFYYHVVFVF